MNISKMLMQYRVVQLHILQGMTGVYLITYTYGYEMWKFTLPVVQLTAAEAFEIIVYGMLHSTVLLLLIFGGNFCVVFVCVCRFYCP